MNEHLPNISIIMPVLNEVNYLQASIASLIDLGGYPLDKLELLLIDGGSTDGTLDLIDSITRKRSCVRKLINRKKITPTALNLGIKQAAFDVILRADAHALYKPNYIINSVRPLLDGRGANVGGAIESLPNQSRFSQVLAAILNSPLGNGSAGYRRGQTGKPVDTVWCGCWYKSTLLDLGGFDERWVNNQDAELNARLREIGQTSYLADDVEAKLVVRDSFPAMVRQYFKYGVGRAMTVARYPKFLKLRQVLPIFGSVIFLAVFLAYPLLGFLTTVASSIAFGTYLSFSNEKPPLLPAIAWSVLILVGMNVGWAMGFVLTSIRVIFTYDVRIKYV